MDWDVGFGMQLRGLVCVGLEVRAVGENELDRCQGRRRRSLVRARDHEHRELASLDVLLDQHVAVVSDEG